MSAHGQTIMKRKASQKRLGPERKNPVYCSSIAFGNQTISKASRKTVARHRRFTALRTYLAAGLPLSCAIFLERA